MLVSPMFRFLAFLSVTRAFIVPRSNHGCHSIASITTRLASEKGVPRHDVVGGAPVVVLSPEEQDRMERYSQHQKDAPKLDWATDVRTLIQYNHGFAVMSTFSKQYPEYPGGSVVGFAPDEEGRPLFVFSGMSTHTQDVLVNPHCSLTIAAKDFKGAADGRVNLMGTCQLLRDPQEQQKAKEIYLQKHPGAFWVNFGDFNWFRMQVEHVSTCIFFLLWNSSYCTRMSFEIPI
jgi:hypothetical protein